MPDTEERWSDNVPGRYYVNKDCVVCTVCSDMAPLHFTLAKDEDHYFVSLQPRNEKEEAVVKAAMEGCPMGAVCDDG